MDFLRVAAIALVVGGHALGAVILAGRGAFTPGPSVSLGLGERALTWLFQVMPVIFIVGGFANAGSWTRAHARGERWATWVERRARRLLRPLVPLVAFWLVAVPVVLATVVSRAEVEFTSRVALGLVWFLGVYLFVVACVPLTWALHRRFGFGTLAAFAAIAAGIDALVRAGAPPVPYASLAVVWGGLHQMGYFVYEERWPRSATGRLALSGGGLAAALALVFLAGYPASMVDVGVGERTNTNPPTLALFGLALAQLGLILLARRPLERWLEGRRARALVRFGGGVAIHVYLWHVTALVLALAFGYAIGLWSDLDALSARAWAVTLGFALLFLAAFVALARRWQARGEPARPAAVPITVLGVTAALLGIAGLARGGVYAATSSTRLQWPTLVSLGVGLVALRAFGRARR